MLIRTILPFTSAHGPTPKGSVIDVPDDLGAAYIAGGLAVGVEPVPQRQVAVAPVLKTRTKAISPKAPRNEV